MPAFEQKTVVRSYKLRIKNKCESIAEETENVISLLRSSVSMFRNRMKEVVENNDGNFFTLFDALNGDFERYQDKLYLLLAAIENPADSVNENETPFDNCEISAASENHDKESTKLPSVQNAPTETNANTALPSQASSISSASYRSFQEEYTCSVSQQNVNEEMTLSQFSSLTCETYNTVDGSDTLLHHQGRTSPNLQTATVSPSYDLELDTHQTFSPSSCYRSLSSNISASQGSCISLNTAPRTSQFEATEIEGYENFEHSETFDQGQRMQIRPSILILPSSISIPTTISATLTHIVTPDDFWMQLENSKRYNLSVSLAQLCEESPITNIQGGDFCYAPFKSVPYYYRAKVISLFAENEVEVFFIDHGSTQVVSLQSLRPLPPSAYQIPTQAIHCCLCDISPIGGKWTEPSIAKMKEFQNNSIETRIRSLKCGKYAVQLITTVSAFFGEDYSFDIAQSLCVDGLATMSDSSQVQLNGSEISNQTSCDSGVSVTSNPHSSPSSQRRHLSSDRLVKSDPYKDSQPLDVLKWSGLPELIQDIGSLPNNYSQSDAADLISFESAEEMYSKIRNEVNGIQVEDSHISHECSKTDDCSCPLHLVVPPPSMPFVEKDMMLVMLSNIVTPNEFYVNPAMDDCLTLDELREQMTSTYESSSPSDRPIDLGEVQEGMYLAGRYDQDRNWYRVKVLRINSEVFTLLNFYPKSKRSCDVYVQYVDYGNKALMKFSDMRPLTPQFAAHPSFSIKCSLLGVTPRLEKERLDEGDTKELIVWSEKAIKQFRLLTNYERVLTAQICRSRADIATVCPISASLECETIQVLLWDTEGTKDLLINEALAENDLAYFDSAMYQQIQEMNMNIDHREESTLNKWNPMRDDFVDIENSYGVHAEEGEVAISGYKPQDESYICKYFSLRGKCPRGIHCEFEHVALAEGGVTRDQDVVYSLDPLPPLPNPFSNVLVQVSAVINPGQFYCILPFGNKDVDDIDAMAGRGSLQECSMKDEVKALFREMNEHYTNTPFAENTSVALPYGSIVAAWRRSNNSWHRGRILDVSDVKGPVTVFFVDYGDEDDVPRGCIREILPQFLYTPFQAVECHLSDVEPLGFEKGMKWSPNSLYRFKELVALEVLLAHVTYRCGKVLHLTLRKTTATDHRGISESLVREGFAQYRLQNKKSSSKQKESIYVPG